MKKNICLGYSDQYNIDNRLMKIKNQGFDGVFIFYDEYEKLKSTVETIRSFTLDIEMMHLPFKGCNHLWDDSQEGDAFKALLMDGIISAGLLKIPTVIIHLVGGLDRPRPNEIGLQRIKELISLCETYKVNLALENVRETAHNDYIFEQCSSPFLKMCFDFGHINCFTKNTYQFAFEKYNNLIICCHIHDNNGIFDQHMMPFTGNVDYKYLVKKLKMTGYNGPLTSEVMKDSNLDEDEFLSQVWTALNKIELLFGDEID